MGLTIKQQDEISDAGASVCRNAQKEGWKLNPYSPRTVEHDIWLEGYEREAERIGSQGKDW